MCSISTIGDFISKQFSEEKGDKMSVFPAMVDGLSVNLPVGTIRRALVLAELSGNDTVSITISLERLVRLVHTVSCLVGQQLDEDVMLVMRRCRPMRNLVLDLGIGCDGYSGTPCEPS